MLRSGMKTTGKSTRKSGSKKSKTWEHPTGSGIKISELPNKTGGKIYGVSYRVRIPAELLGRTGIRETHQRKTRADAERLAEERLLALRAHGTSFADLPAKAQKEAAIAWGMLNEHSLSFVEAAEAAIKALRPAGGQRTLAQVLDELRQSKKSRFDRGELDARTEEDFRSRSLKIEAAMGSTLTALITGDDLTKWLRQLRTSGLSLQDKRALSRRSVLN